MVGAALAVALAGCARAPYVWVYDLPEQVLTGKAARVAPGDHLFVFVRDQPTMSGEVIVALDHTIVLPVVGQVSVQDSDVTQITERVTQGLTNILDNPVVRVSLVSQHPARVIVIGEVRNPGAYAVDGEAGVVDALAQAGGLTEFAKHQRVFVVRSGEQPVRVRFRYAELAAGEAASRRFVLLDGDVVVAE